MFFVNNKTKNSYEPIESNQDPSLPSIQVLYEKYREMVFVICKRYAKNIDDANDLTQNVFLKIISAQSSFRGESQISTWIYRITTYEAIDHLRKNQIRRQRENEFRVQYEEEFQTEPTPDVGFEIDRRALHNVLSKVGETDRFILLKIVEGKKQSQIAKFLGVSRVAVFKRLSKMRNLFAEEYFTKQSDISCNSKSNSVFNCHFNYEELNSDKIDIDLVESLGKPHKTDYRLYKSESGDSEYKWRMEKPIPICRNEGAHTCKGYLGGPKLNYCDSFSRISIVPREETTALILKNSHCNKTDTQDFKKWDVPDTISDSKMLILPSELPRKSNRTCLGLNSLSNCSLDVATSHPAVFEY